MNPGVFETPRVTSRQRLFRCRVRVTPRRTFETTRANGSTCMCMYIYIYVYACGHMLRFICAFLCVYAYTSRYVYIMSFHIMPFQSVLCCSVLFVSFLVFYSSPFFCILVLLYSSLLYYTTLCYVKLYYVILGYMIYLGFSSCQCHLQKWLLTVASARALPGCSLRTWKRRASRAGGFDVSDPGSRPSTVARHSNVGQASRLMFLTYNRQAARS